MTNKGAGQRGMGKILTGIILSLLALSALTAIGCKGRGRDERPADTVRFKIPVSSPNGVRMESVELVSVEDTVWLGGWAAQIFSNPFEKDGELSGHKMRIQTMRNRDGDYVALDDQSLQLMTLYANQEKLYFLDQKTGVLDLVNIQAYLRGEAEQKSQPRKIAISANLPDPTGMSTYEKNGARYVGKWDAILFSPYVLSSLKLTLNSGVLAHEHFHSIFQKLFLNTVNNKKILASSIDDNWDPFLADEFQSAIGKFLRNRNSKTQNNTDADRVLYHDILLRGMNEGLADVWGWIVSEDPSFVERSLGAQQAFRKIDPKNNHMWSKEELIAVIAKQQNSLGAIPYQFGSQLARKVLSPVFESSIPRSEAKILLAKSLVRALAPAASLYAQDNETEYFDPDVLIQKLQDQSKDFKWK